MKPLQQFFRTLPFLVFYKTKFSMFLTFGQWKECRGYSQLLRNNKFCKNQKQQKSTSIAAVLLRFPCLIFVDHYTTLCRRGCSHFNSSGKGQGYFAERRMQNGIVLRRLENNAKLLSRPICILRTMPFYVLRSAKYPCRLVKVTKRTVLSPFKVVVTTQTCFQLVIY